MPGPIQVDMFAVGLGASILVQARHRGRTIRILADGGVDRGFATDLVLGRLDEAFASFGDPTRRLDVVIGTHYDADHLDGLVPILEDRTLEIGDVWLPPVVDDRDGIESKALLAPHLLDDPEAIGAYLDHKADEVQALVRIERQIGDRQDVGVHREAVARERSRWLMEPPRGSRDDRLRWFLLHEADATTDGWGEEGDVRAEAMEPAEGSLRRLELDGELVRWRWRYAYPFRFRDAHEALARMASVEPDLAQTVRRGAARQRARTAREAINAASLDRVMEALRTHRAGVPVAYRAIEAGVPERYRWSDRRRLFRGGSSGDASTPEIVLLGPSEGLVDRHRDRLPPGSYGQALMWSALVAPDLLAKPITPSNQLSYVLRLNIGGQALLVCGDAGMVDFRTAPRKVFHAGLIKELRDLAVVQVAHHGGNNKYFYETLRRAGFGTSDAWLLFSHAVADRFRPSVEFSRFIAATKATEETTHLLFTSEPKPDKVDDVDELIEPVVGGPQAKSGDVRLVFDGTEWTVVRHAVHVP